LIKSEQDTDPAYGKRPDERSVEELMQSCVVVVDKHSGPTSHQVTAWLGEMFGADKTGHAGTLDPAVTGVLPVALGNATKAMPVLMGIKKEYVGVMKLHAKVGETLLRETFAKFVGKITQTPPIKSAVARKPRQREVYFFDIIEISDDGRDVLFKVECEAGTYIRKLCHDVGAELGVGAHMSELRRTKAGEFTEQQALPLVDIKDTHEFWKEDAKTGEAALRKILIPTEYAILHVKRVFVKDSAVDAITHGSPLYAAGVARVQKGIIRGETIAVYTLKDELVALGITRKTSKEMAKAKRGIVVRTDRVFMEKGVYPKSERKPVRKSERKTSKKKLKSD
jgi:H/ACA ribonucleoprotein complex subunit 4